MKKEDPAGQDLDDIEFDRYALRTFKVNYAKRRLESITQTGGPFWDQGKCVARCTLGRPSTWAGRHEAPQENCSCGVYGTLTLNALNQFGRSYMVELITVFAAEGKTIIGDVGLRTKAARIVAYWSPVRAVRMICEEQLPEATEYADLDKMLKAYGLERGPKLPWINRLLYSPRFDGFWCGWCLTFCLWDAKSALENILSHQWGFALTNILCTALMIWSCRRQMPRLLHRLGIV